MTTESRKMTTQDGLPREQKMRSETDCLCLDGELEKKDFLSQLPDAVPDVLGLYDVAKQNCIYVNRQLSAVLGFSESEIREMGSTLFEKLLYPEDVQPFAEGIVKLQASQDDDIYDTEYRLRHVNGEWRRFHFRMTVFTRDSRGVPDLILYTARDMTNHWQYEETLRQREVLMALSRMSKQIAHEINTPLANIKNSLFLLRKAILLDHPDAKYLRWSEEEIDRIAEAVRQLSLHTQLES